MDRRSKQGRSAKLSRRQRRLVACKAEEESPFGWFSTIMGQAEPSTLKDAVAQIRELRKQLDAAKASRDKALRSVKDAEAETKATALSETLIASKLKTAEEKLKKVVEDRNRLEAVASSALEAKEKALQQASRTVQVAEAAESAATSAMARADVAEKRASRAEARAEKLNKELQTALLAATKTLKSTKESASGYIEESQKAANEMLEAERAKYRREIAATRNRALIAEEQLDGLRTKPMWIRKLLRL